ncbi:hypothetical protein LO771_05835 [Streptacidiphilus sp. ASG 303]|uniref:hypothetical protein n=1 Tax=Streptacidiphilus sp. ASG 303 TaxID=2896847 RepID=UPI001E6328B7|nr:hypothetical protein [Streptacidiphilus sp. ASG 303]MCD0481946.1 hypothetical protein [Streptacidiphilus sp. ASG 303]
MAKIGSGTVVTGLTLGAMAAVAALAVQAQGTGRKAAPASPPPPSGASASPRPGAAQAPPVPALPAASGTGRRVVYSLGADRVWLVDPARTPQVVRSFRVRPSAVDPAPGTYGVFSRRPAVTGSDGRPIEHVLLFARSSGVPVGFSAAVDGSLPTPVPGSRTGGIRETRADGAALWRFAPLQSRVVVVP